MMRLRPVNNASAADIIIGNPPFGNSNNQLWSFISNKEIDGLKKDAVIAFITPQNFIYQTQADGCGAQAYYLKHKMHKYNHLVDLDVKKQFPSVCSSFAGWALQKKTKFGEIKLSGDMGSVVEKFMAKRDDIVITDANNDSANQRKSRSPVKEGSFIYLVITGKVNFYSNNKPKFYEDLKVIGSTTGASFIVRENCGITHSGYMYFRKGFEYELCHAYNAKIIKNYLLFHRNGVAIPCPVMRQLPNFSDDALLSIRKLISDTGEKIEVESKELSAEVRSEINEIVKSDMSITDKDEEALEGMLKKMA